MIPIIAISASVLDMETPDFKRAGFNEYLKKPFSIKEVHGMLEKYLAGEESKPPEEEPAPGTGRESEDVSEELKEYMKKELLPLIESYRSGGFIADVGSLGKEVARVAEEYKSPMMSELGEEIISAAEAIDIEKINFLLERILVISGGDGSHG